VIHHNFEKNLTASIGLFNPIGFRDFESRYHFTSLIATFTLPKHDVHTRNPLMLINGQSIHILPGYLSPLQS
jgi:hypothetical protein